MPVPDEYNFTIEYAKSNRSTCRTTGEKIEKGALRIGMLIQSETFDGRLCNWHVGTKEGFFKGGNKGLISPTLVHGWDEVKPADQKLVEALIADSLGGEEAASAAAAAAAASSASSPIFSPPADGKKARGKGKGKRGAAQEPQASAKKAARKPSAAEKKYAEEKAAYEKESELQWQIKEKLAETCRNKDLQKLLEHNGLPFKGAGVGGAQDLQRNAKDAMCYGIAQSPGEAGGCCDRGTTLLYDPAAHCFKCGRQGDWGSCLFTCAVDEATVVPLEIPEELLEHEYLGSFQCEMRERLQKPVDPSENLAQLKMQAVAAKYKAGSKVQAEALRSAAQADTVVPFADLVFCFLTADADLSEKVAKLGGVTKATVTKNTTHLIATEDEYTEPAGKHRKMVKAAAALETCVVVSPEWIDRTFEAKNRRDDRVYRLDLSAEEKELLEKRGWGRKRKQGQQLEEQEGQGQQQQPVVKGRAAVDPDAAEVTTGKKMWTETLNEETAQKEWELTALPSYMGTHVLDEGERTDDERSMDALYDFLGNLTDVGRNVNSYYGLQVIESDEKDRWWVFRKWGRVGTDIGNRKLDEYESKEEAIAAFEKFYGDKTGNDWQEGASGVAFKKMPSCFFPVERSLEGGGAAVGGGGAGKQLATVTSDSRSALDPRVQDLMCLIFDVKLMEDSLREMEVDLKKMPLGTLSKTQINAGYEVLSAIQDVLEPPASAADEDDASETESKGKAKAKGKGNGKGKAKGKGKGKKGKAEETAAGISAAGAAAKAQQQLSDLSNRFYTLIPHDFGLGRMKIISSTEDLRAKIKMIEALLDIEAAVTMLSAAVEADDDSQKKKKKKQKKAKPGSEEQQQAAAAPVAEVDQHYAKLHCRLNPVEPETETFKLLQKYVDVGKTPSGLAAYEKFPKLTLSAVFEVEREGEDEAFEKGIGNRKLLWHGSGTSNFGGAKKNPAAFLSHFGYAQNDLLLFYQGRLGTNIVLGKARSSKREISAFSFPHHQVFSRKGCESRRLRRPSRAIVSGRALTLPTSSARAAATRGRATRTRFLLWPAMSRWVTSGRRSATSIWTRRSLARSRRTRSVATRRRQMVTWMMGLAAWCRWAKSSRRRSMANQSGRQA
jgi:poly [ADP-ribose] polymerase